MLCQESPTFHTVLRLKPFLLHVASIFLCKVFRVEQNVGFVWCQFKLTALDQLHKQSDILPCFRDCHKNSKNMKQCKTQVSSVVRVPPDHIRAAAGLRSGTARTDTSAYSRTVSARNQLDRTAKHGARYHVNACLLHIVPWTLFVFVYLIRKPETVVLHCLNLSEESFARTFSLHHVDVLKNGCQNLQKRDPVWLCCDLIPKPTRG